MTAEQRSLWSQRHPAGLSTSTPVGLSLTAGAEALEWIEQRLRAVAGDSPERVSNTNWPNDGSWYRGHVAGLLGHPLCSYPFLIGQPSGQGDAWLAGWLAAHIEAGR